MPCWKPSFIRPAQSLPTAVQRSAVNIRFFHSSSARYERDTGANRNDFSSRRPTTAGVNPFTWQPPPDNTHSFDMATLKPRRAIREDPAQYRREFSGGNRGYWTILVPTSHLEVPPPHLLTVEYDAWFRESYWESDFGLKNLARRFYISGTKLRDLKGTPFPKIAIDWGTYDRLSMAYSFFYRDVTSDLPFRLNIDATYWPLSEPLTTQLRIQNIQKSIYPHEIRAQFPDLPEPKSLRIGNYGTLPPGCTSGIYATWKCETPADAFKAIKQGPVGADEKKTWKLQAKADASEIIAKLLQDAGVEKEKADKMVQATGANAPLIDGVESQLTSLFSKTTGTDNNNV